MQRRPAKTRRSLIVLRTLVKFLTAPDAAPIYRAKGLDPA